MSIKDAPLATPAARRLDVIGRVLLGVAAVATMVAFIGSFWIVADATENRLWVEFWRTTAYGVFAGLFAMLALAPRSRWGVWELVFAQKVAVTIFGVVNITVNEARQATIVDGCLVVIMVAAWFLCRGWSAWRPRPA